MKEENRKSPKLRFSGFIDDWEQRKVTEIGKIYIGLVTTMTSHYTDQGTLLIRNSDIKEGRFEFGNHPIYLDDKFAEQNASRKHRLGDVITVHTGDIGTSAIITEKEAGSIGFATIVTRPDTRIITSEYLCAYLNTDTHKNFAMNISTGDGRNNYNLKDYYECVIPIPSLGEQTKISGFIDNLNNLITLHQHKLDQIKEYKKGMLQKMFPKKGETVPEVRFPGFEGDWEEKKLGQLFSFVKTKNTNGLIDNVITNSAEYGLIPQREYFDKDIAVEGHTENYTIIEKGNFVYNPRKSTSAPYGPFNCYKLDEKGVVSPLYTCLDLEDSEYAEYLIWYFKTDKWHPYIQSNGAQGGARHDRVGMTNDLMKGIPILLPSVPEQKQIGEFFENLDFIITFHQYKIDEMKEYKKGLLQQMFV